MNWRLVLLFTIACAAVVGYLEVSGPLGGQVTIPPNSFQAKVKGVGGRTQNTNNVLKVAKGTVITVEWNFPGMTCAGSGWSGGFMGMGPTRQLEMTITQPEVLDLQCYNGTGYLISGTAAHYPAVRTRILVTLTNVDFPPLTPNTFEAYGANGERMNANNILKIQKGTDVFVEWNYPDYTCAGGGWMGGLTGMSRWSSRVMRNVTETAIYDLKCYASEGIPQTFGLIPDAEKRILIVFTDANFPTLPTNEFSVFGVRNEAVVNNVIRVAKGTDVFAQWKYPGMTCAGGGWAGGLVGMATDKSMILPHVTENQALDLKCFTGQGMPIYSSRTPDVDRTIQLQVYDAVCKDGKTEGFEQCDDNNSVETDGCSSSCTAIECSDGKDNELDGYQDYVAPLRTWGPTKIVVMDPSSDTGLPTTQIATGLTAGQVLRVSAITGNARGKTCKSQLSADLFSTDEMIFRYWPMGPEETTNRLVFRGWFTNSRNNPIVLYDGAQIVVPPGEDTLEATVGLYGTGDCTFSGTVQATTMDPQCTSLSDATETDTTAGGSSSSAASVPACRDAKDNDGDGFIDFDPTAPVQNTKSHCQDGIDNDLDGAKDGSDIGCTETSGESEANAIGTQQDFAYLAKIDNRPMKPGVKIPKGSTYIVSWNFSNVNGSALPTCKTSGTRPEWNKSSVSMIGRQALLSLTPSDTFKVECEQDPNSTGTTAASVEFPMALLISDTPGGDPGCVSADSNSEVDIDPACRITNATYCSTGKCPGNIMGFQNHTYLQYGYSTSWQEAQSKCVTAGGNLVSLSSDAERDAVDLLIGTATDTWIGMNDRAQEGAYEWVSKEPITYTGFYFPGQPNNYSNEDCAIVHHGLWPKSMSKFGGDYPCEEGFGGGGFVCEIQKDCGTITPSATAATINGVSCKQDGFPGPTTAQFEGFESHAFSIIPSTPQTSISSKVFSEKTLKNLGTALVVQSMQNPSIKIRFIDPDTQEKITVPGNTLRILLGREAQSGATLVARSFDYTGQKLEEYRITSTQSLANFSLWHVSELEVFIENGTSFYIDNLGYGPLECVPIKMGYVPPSSRSSSSKTSSSLVTSSSKTSRSISSKTSKSGTSLSVSSRAVSVTSHSPLSGLSSVGSNTSSGVASEQSSIVAEGANSSELFFLPNDEEQFFFPAAGSEASSSEEGVELFFLDDRQSISSSSDGGVVLSLMEQLFPWHNAASAVSEGSESSRSSLQTAQSQSSAQTEEEITGNDEELTEAGDAKASALFWQMVSLDQPLSSHRFGWWALFLLVCILGVFLGAVIVRKLTKKREQEPSSAK